MIVFLISFYLVLISLYLILARPKKKHNFVKNKYKKVCACKGKIPNKLFCSKFSREYRFFKKIQSSCITIEKESIFNCYKSALQKSGIDFSIPIFKIELYNNDAFEEVLNNLLALKNLENKGVNFNLFVFVDSYEKLKKVKKILEITSFKRSLVRSYHCLEIDYKLLGAINFFNLNREEEVFPIKQIACDIGGASKNKVVKLSLVKRKKDKPFLYKNLGCSNSAISGDFELNFNKEQLDYMAGFSGLFLVHNNECVKVENYIYNNLMEQKDFQLDDVEIVVKRVFDFEINAQIYKVTLQNISNDFVSLKTCFGTVFCNLTHKNIVYVVESKSDKLNLNLKTTNETLLLCGEKFEKQLTKNFMGGVKSIKLLPNELKEFYFINFLDISNFKNFEVKKISSALFNAVVSKYKNIKLPKVFSENKSINDLINFYLPQRIFEKTIKTHNVNNIDFLMLKNLIFDAKLVNKELINGRISGLYLLNQNLFSIFQNLMYFYFGIFPTKLGANINTDKSLVLNNATTSFEIGEKKIVVTFKNLGLKNEVQINNIKYSNLKFLTFNNYQQNEIEVLY